MPVRQLVTAWSRALRNRNLAQPPPFSVCVLDACSHPPTHPSQFALQSFPLCGEEFPCWDHRAAFPSCRWRRAALPPLSLSSFLSSLPLPSCPVRWGQLSVSTLCRSCLSSGGGKDGQPSSLSAENNVVMIQKQHWQSSRQSADGAEPLCNQQFWGWEPPRNHFSSENRLALAIPEAHRCSGDSPL